jgi:hypothetical protein
MESVSGLGWAAETFGRTKLGDCRRTRRLVKLAADLANRIGASVATSSSDSAALEGAYRFVRNEAVSPEQIKRGGVTATAIRAASSDTILAIEDTTTLSYTHAVIEQLGDVGAPSAATTRGVLAHSVLLVDATSGITIGLGDQQYWMRTVAGRGRRGSRRRPWNDKESAKWRRSSEAVRALLGDDKGSRVVSVCDREADIYQYLGWKLSRAERFIVRAAWSRAVESHDDRPIYLWQTMEKARVVARVTVMVPQRAGRGAREATLIVRSRRVRLRRPHRLTLDEPSSLAMGAVLVREENPPPGVEPLEWMLLTSEPVDTASTALTVIGYYRRRWRIEDFHKMWKSGAGVERCRMQRAAHLLRFAVILAFVAVRVLQLREQFEADPDSSCTTVLTETEWKVLWVAVEKTRPPKQPPSAKWAYHAVGRLGGWHDTKRTGRVGPQTLIDGWLRLQERVAGYESTNLLHDNAKK